MIRAVEKDLSGIRPEVPEHRVGLVPQLPSSAPPSQRLLSLDALRGFTMFWIVGGRELMLALVACAAPSFYDAFETQVTHPRWEGFVAWDLIMPVFLFLVGTSMPFAMAKHLEYGRPARDVYWRIARRVAILWVLGMVAQGSLLLWRFDSLELFSNTLQAIAVGYLVASLALLHLSLAGQVALMAGLTLVYGAVLTLIPFDGHPGGTLERTANFPRYVDELILGGFRRQHSFTWIVTSLGFSATVLLGTTAGHLLRGRLPAGRKVLALVTIGLALGAAGWGWSYFLPLNRHLWTSSMVLWAGGWSFLFLALFYTTIDVAGVKAWAFPWIVLGANALAAYVFDHVFGQTLSDVLLGNLARQWPTSYGELLLAVGEVGILWLGLWYLYRNRTFLRA